MVFIPPQLDSLVSLVLNVSAGFSIELGSKIMFMQNTPQPLVWLVNHSLHQPTDHHPLSSPTMRSSSHHHAPPLSKSGMLNPLTHLHTPEWRICKELLMVTYP